MVQVAEVLVEAFGSMEAVAKAGGYSRKGGRWMVGRVEDLGREERGGRGSSALTMQFSSIITATCGWKVHTPAREGGRPLEPVVVSDTATIFNDC